MRKILLATIVFACLLGVAEPIEALPGDSLQTAIRTYRQNPLFQGLDIEKIYFGEVGTLPVPVEVYATQIRGYELTPVRHGRYSFAYGILAAQGGRVLKEEVGRIAPRLVNLFEQKDYDPRQDLELVKLMTRVWGQAIANDFTSSRFTDNFERNTRIWHLFEGRSFVYEVYYSRYGDRYDQKQGDLDGVSVTSLEYIDYLRLREIPN